VKLAALASVAVLILIMAALAFLAQKSRQMQPEAGMVNHHLRPCPEQPHCMCSEPGTPAHQRVEPLKADWPTLREALQRMGGTIHQDDGHYLHASFRSPLFGFVDDLEARLDKPGLIQIRSASRVGHSDLGANRRRIERLRQCIDALKKR